ncbi:MAG: hypothetical protein M1820_008824 [Bogoriella megaspora]|nr:MAG: hypothetical protein M1820_008824 [Bogoriella megaspora]
MSYTHSKKWQSPDFVANRKWAASMKAFNNNFPNYEFKPTNRAAFMEDLRLYTHDKAELKATKAANTEDWNKRVGQDWKPFNGRQLGNAPGYEDSQPRGTVLAQETIWSSKPHYPDATGTANWPSEQEMEFEGDGRVNSKTKNLGRFAPVPRQPEHPAVHWNTWSSIGQLPFDEVWPIPTLEDVYLPVDEVPEDEAEGIVGKQLLDAIEEAGNANQ